MRFNIVEARQGRLNNYKWHFIGALLLLLAGQAYAADHLVSSSTSTVNCGSFGGGVRPGDVIVLAAGARGPLTVRNCSGTSEKPIVIRNDAAGNGPTVIRRTSASSGGFVFACRDCTHVVIDGTGKWKGAPQSAYCGAPAGRNGCGIKITTVAAGDSPSAYVKLVGMSTKVTVRGVEVDGRMSDLGTKGIGIDQNDHSVKAADNPGFWREDCVYENNYVHNTGNSGLYIGPNWREPDLDVPLRNITIRHNLVEDTGRDSMKLKMAIAGTNRIHHNVLRRSGLRGEPSFGTGIAVFEGGHNVKIHHNWVESAGAQGIQHYNMNIPSSKGPFSSEIYNNVVYDAGSVLGADTTSHGITVAFRSGSASITPKVYNNTVVKTARAGINFGSGVVGGVARDNIVAAWGSSAISVGDNTKVNNRAGTIDHMKFVNAGGLNFALSGDSPARDAGSSAGFPADDYMLVLRPQGGKPDQGAFEFSTATAAPKAPGLTNVK